MRDKSKRENERQNERERMRDKIKDMMNNKMREKWVRKKNVKERRWEKMNSKEIRYSEKKREWEVKRVGEEKDEDREEMKINFLICQWKWVKEKREKLSAR